METKAEHGEEHIPYIRARPAEVKLEQPEVMLSDYIAAKDRYPLPLGSPLLSALQRSTLPPCAACSRAAGYKCTECAAAYCTVACFKQHNGGQCNEAFSKRQVEQNLAGIKANPKQRKAMAATLQQHRDARENDEGLDQEEAERILKSNRSVTRQKCLA